MIILRDVGTYCALFDEFDIRHISRAENSRANSLAQEASGYRITRGKFHISKNPIIRDMLSSQAVDRPTPAESSP
jgi:hypothetical protein